MATKKRLPPRKANGQFKKAGRSTAKRTRNPSSKAPKRARKIGRRARGHAVLSDRYTLSALPDSEVMRVTSGDTYFAVRGGAGTLGVVRSGRVVGWIDVGRLHHLSVRDWMQHVGQPKTRNPAKKAPKRKRAGRPLREGQRVYHCAKKCR